MWVVQLKEVRPPKSVLNLMYKVAPSKRAWVKFYLFFFQYVNLLVRERLYETETWTNKYSYI